MEPYEITISGKKLTVVPLDDGTYSILQGARRIASLWIDITAAGITWAAEKITLQFAEQIGALINAHER
uniref:hypothetical protein n=1 Tax=Pedobacter schmidteae TaxID=2201271 RepID=UPI0013CECAE2|nr:hypothetical protein [Pedobacter schmidteae]